jgi:outer membrane protein TolC
LNSLIERAIRANLDIAVALSRVQEARERDVAVFGGTLPAIGAAASEARGSGGEAVKGRIPSSLDAGTNSRGIQDITAIAGFDAVWEIDLFGKYRRLLEATRYDTQAAIAAHHAALITIIAEVARNYVVLRGTQTRLKVAEENVSHATLTVQFTQAQYNRGITDEFPLSLAKRELASLQSGIAPLTADIAAAKSRLAVLLGIYSQTLDKELAICSPGYSCWAGWASRALFRSLAPPRHFTVRSGPSARARTGRCLISAGSTRSSTWRNSRPKACWQITRKPF